MLTKASTIALVATTMASAVQINSTATSTNTAGSFTYTCESGKSFSKLGCNHWFYYDTKQVAVAGCWIYSDLYAELQCAYEWCCKHYDP